MKQNKMVVLPMPQLMLNMSLPLMLSLLIQSLYNIVDSIFVAKLGENALTATSLAFPVQILMIAVSVGTSVGVNAVLSKSIGAKNTAKTGAVATTGILLALVATLVFMLLGLTAVPFFVSLFTDQAEISRDCAQYLTTCMVFCVGHFLATMYQRFLQAVGNTCGSMLSLVAGALTNLVLDPILIFGLLGAPALGVRGAAIATVIGQCVSAIAAIALNKFCNPVVTPVWRGYRPEREIIKQIYQVGLPTMITQAMGCIMVSAFNAILMMFSSTAVAFFGVYYKLQNFLFMPINGLGQAAIPIVGFHYGAKNWSRIQSAFKAAIPFAVGIALVMTAIFMLFPEALLLLFHPTQALLAIGVPALRIIAPTFAFASVSIILGYAVSGLGIGTVNMLATALRQFVVLMPLVYLFANCFGVSAVWYAIWIAEGIALAYALWHTRKILKRIEAKLVQEKEEVV